MNVLIGASKYINSMGLFPHLGNTSELVHVSVQNQTTTLHRFHAFTSNTIGLKIINSHAMNI